jgi:hypothetical protein
MPDQTEPSPQRNNGRTAVVLVSIALVFFLGVIANRVLFG